MQDGGHLAREALGGLWVEPQTRLLDVSGHGAQALVRRQARCGARVVLGAHERVDPPSVPIEQSAQDLSADEARGAGEQHRAHSSG